MHELCEHVACRSVERAMWAVKKFFNNVDCPGFRVTRSLRSRITPGDAGARWDREFVLRRPIVAAMLSRGLVANIHGSSIELCLSFTSLIHLFNRFENTLEFVVRLTRLGMLGCQCLLCSQKRERIGIRVGRRHGGCVLDGPRLPVR